MGPALGVKSANALALNPVRAIEPGIAYPPGRQTIDDRNIQSGYPEYAQRPDTTGSWRVLETQRKSILSLGSDRLVEIALELSPQVSKGVWDFIRFGNPGYLFDVLDPAGNRIEESYRAIEDFLDMLSDRYGSFDALLDTMYGSLFVMGAFFLELVLGEGAMEAVNINVIDPATAVFRRSVDPVLGQIWELGQFHGYGDRNWVLLQGNPCVKYVGLDTLPNRPYGRPMITPSTYASIFLLGLIQDLRRVVANQGINRLDYEISTDEMLKLIALAGDDIAGNDEKTAQFITRHLEQIRTELRKLDVDSNYVHLDTVKVNYAQGGTGLLQMSGIDTLVRLLERQITNGLKSINLLMNSNEAVSETHANRQLDFYLGAVESNQNELSKIIRKFLTIVLRVQGLPGEVMWNQKKQRVTDRRTIAETQKIQIDNIIAKRDGNLITPEQAIMESQALVDPLEIQ